jgi:hypothetical protein
VLWSPYSPLCPNNCIGVDGNDNIWKKSDPKSMDNNKGVNRFRAINVGALNLQLFEGNSQKCNILTVTFITLENCGM